MATIVGSRRETVALIGSDKVEGTAVYGADDQKIGTVQRVMFNSASIGLHQRDNARLLDTLRRLRELGNTVIVVEHDEDAILAADYVVDIGPGAGVHGGEIVAEGPPEAIKANPNSLTGHYLTGERSSRSPPSAGSPRNRAGAEGHRRARQQPEERHGLYPARPLHVHHRRLGGGKSTLVIDTLYKSVARQLNGEAIPAPHERLDRLAQIDKVTRSTSHRSAARHAPIPRHTGAFTPIRDWFADLPEAKQRGYAQGRFSFNVKGGRCEACQGDGVIKIEMHFLPDVYVTCDVCKGQALRPRDARGAVQREKSIADVLDMTVEEAAALFKAAPRSARAGDP